jgi:hypothetical protein
VTEKIHVLEFTGKSTTNASVYTRLNRLVFDLCSQLLQVFHFPGEHVNRRSDAPWSKRSCRSVAEEKSHEQVGDIQIQEEECSEEGRKEVHEKTKSSGGVCELPFRVAAPVNIALPPLSRTSTKCRRSYVDSPKQCPPTAPVVYFDRYSSSERAEPDGLTAGNAGQRDRECLQWAEESWRREESRGVGSRMTLIRQVRRRTLQCLSPARIQDA